MIYSSSSTFSYSSSIKAPRNAQRIRVTHSTYCSPGFSRSGQRVQIPTKPGITQAPRLTRTPNSHPPMTPISTTA